MKFLKSMIVAITLIIPTAIMAKPQTVVLDANNTVVLKGVINDLSAAKTSQKLLELSTKLKPTDTIYLFLDTPGGSIVAGQQLIELAQSLPQKVTTVTRFAASMGFMTVESLGPRYVLPTGVLMSHLAAASAEGTIPGQLNTRVNYYTTSVQHLEQRVADRLNMSLEDYQSMRINEYWVEGQDAITDKVADEVVTAKCSKNMMGTYKETIYTIFGAINVVFSQCPLISGPVGVDTSNVKFDKIVTKKDWETYEEATSIIYNSSDYLNYKGN